MRICFYSMGRWDTIGEMLSITLPNKLEYCARNGYSFHFEEWSGQGWPGFERLAVLNYLLKCGSYDWVFWLGPDCLITNMGTRLESLVDPNFGIVMATDSTEVQMDSLLVQRDKGGLRMLEEVWNLRGVWTYPNYEQSALRQLSEGPKFRNVIKLVPQKKMNSYRLKWYPDLKNAFDRYNLYMDRLGTPSEWQPGDFVFHIPGREYPTKLRALREMVQAVKRT